MQEGINQFDSLSPEEQSVIKGIESRKKGALEKELAKEKEAKKKIFKEKLNDLADTAIRLRATNPQLAEMLESILGVMLNLEEAMEAISSIQQAMSCVTTAIELMDNAIDMNKLVFNAALAQNHGFFARMKARRQQKKAIRNSINGMKQVANGIVDAFKMVEGMNKSMSSMANTINVSMQKAKAKRDKQAAKGGAPTNERARQFMAERAKSTGASVDTSSTGSSSFGGSGSGTAADDVFGDN